MVARYLGKPIKRSEDPRLLRGKALFVDDIERPGMLHAAFLRSAHAHARIGRIDVSRALAVKGVAAIYTARDLGRYWQNGPLLVPPPPIDGITFNERTQVPLAKEIVRHVGEPIVLVIAQTRYLAEDALEEISVEYEILDPVTDLERALRDNGAFVHPDVGSNIAAHVRQAKGDYARAASRAGAVIRRRFTYDHGISCPIETRGVVADWDAKSERLTVWDTTQAPIPIRNGLAAMLCLNESQVRVVAPFIGGGFGPKIMMFYPEEMLIPWASMQIGRPVKWIEDRSEHFVATTHERSQIHDAEIALTEDGQNPRHEGHLPARYRRLQPYGLTVPINSQCTLLVPMMFLITKVLSPPFSQTSRL